MFFFPLVPAAPIAKPAAARVVPPDPEELSYGGYSSEELQASVPADQTAMLPYVDDDATVETQTPAPDPLIEMRAMTIAASLVGQNAMGNDYASRAFIQQLDDIDSPALRAAVKAQYATMQGESLEATIIRKDDWNDNGDNRDRAAAMQLISAERDRAQTTIAELSPEERQQKQARADRIAADLAASLLAHDDSETNVASIHKKLGGCDAVETELVRAAIRRNFGGKRNLYQLVDDGMDEADSEEQDVAIGMLAGDRVQSAKLALEHESEKGDEANPGRLREIVGRLGPEELAQLHTGEFKYGVLWKIENPADRAELERRIAGDEAGADAERLANLFGAHVGDVPPALRGDIDEANNKRRDEDNVLAEVEAMSGEQVKAAAEAWAAKNPGQPYHVMIAMRWGDNPKVRDRLLAMLAGDKGMNRALRFQRALADGDQAKIEAALAHEQFDPADLESDDPKRRARAEALRDEQASFLRHNASIDSWRADMFAGGEGARTTRQQLDAHYAREERDVETAAALATVLPFGDRLGKRLHNGVHDNRIGGHEMLEDGELSAETRWHRADGADEKAAVAEELASNEQLRAMEAGYRAKYAQQHGYADMYAEVSRDDLADMSASELKIEHNRTLGVAEERPARVQYNVLRQLQATQHSAPLEHDEAGREGGGTQLGAREIIDALGDKLAHPQLPTVHTGDPVIDKAMREMTVTMAQANLDMLGPNADHGLRDGVAPEDAAAIAASGGSMLDAQLDAKKRLGERQAKKIAMVAKVASALTANPWLVLAINGGSNLLQMAAKAEAGGNDYDVKDDAINATKQLGLDVISGGGNLLGHEAIAGILGTSIDTLASGGSFEDFARGVGGQFLPGALGDVAGGGLASNAVSSLTSFGLAVGGGADIGDAALDTGIGFLGGLAQHFMAPPEAPHRADRETAEPIEAVEPTPARWHPDEARNEAMGAHARRDGHSGSDLHSHFMGAASVEDFQTFLGVSEVQLLEMIRGEIRKDSDYAAHYRGEGEDKRFLDSGEGQSAGTGNAAFNNVLAVEKGFDAIERLRSPGGSNADPDVDTQIRHIAHDALNAALNATQQTPYDGAYSIRDTLVKSYIDKQDPNGPKQPYTNFIRMTLGALERDGILYSEQSQSVNKLTNGSMPPEVLARELAVINERRGGQELPPMDVRFLAMVDTKYLGAAGPGTGDDAWTKQLALVKTALQRRDVIGIDVAAPETSNMQAGGVRMQNRVGDLMKILIDQRETAGRNLVFRPHVGEGYVEMPDGDHGHKMGFYSDHNRDHYGNAQSNLWAMADAVDRLRTTGTDGTPLYDPANPKVDIRFGHATHATPELAAKMKELGIVVEANLGSNAITGALQDSATTPQGRSSSGHLHHMDDHSLLTLAATGTSTVLATDGQSVMNTGLRNEHRRAKRILEEFRGEGRPSGKTMPVTREVYESVRGPWGGEGTPEYQLSYAELPPAMKQNIDTALDRFLATAARRAHDVAVGDEYDVRQ